MSSLLRRGLVLSFSRFANQAILLFSPILLVRILSIGEYGSYREFMLYATLLTSVAAFSSPQSLQYFIPKYPRQTDVWVTQAAVFTFLSTCVAIVGIWLARDIIRGKTSFDFVLALQLYVFFFVNLNFFELYWLAKKRTDYVLYLSTGRLAARFVVLLAAAALTKTAESIVYALVAFEAARFFLVLCFGLVRRLFSWRITKARLLAQMSYFLPLGAGSIVVMLNVQLGPLFVSANVGREALALYVIGSFALPVINTFRGAIGDVIFPEMLEIKTASPQEALPLWRRATVYYCALLFPLAVVFAYYSDAFIMLMFTAEYADAVPVFAVFAAMLCVSCFEFHLPLRVQNANRYFVIGNVIALVVNAALLYPLYVRFGLLGPAVARVASQVGLVLYLGYRASGIYEIEISRILPWSQIGKVAMVCMICAPILLLGKMSTDNLLIRAVLFGSSYIVAYLFVVRLMGVWDAYSILGRLLGLKSARVGGGTK